MARLIHPNVARVYMLEQEHGIWFLVQEFIHGENLELRIQRGGPLPIPVALRLVADLASGLDALHQEGIVHRDMKPNNVVVTPADEVKIVDFGLSNLEDEDSSLTREGSIVGTPMFAPLEQFSREYGEVGPPLRRVRSRRNPLLPPHWTCSSHAQRAGGSRLDHGSPRGWRRRGSEGAPPGDPRGRCQARALDAAPSRRRAPEGRAPRGRVADPPRGPVQAQETNGATARRPPGGSTTRRPPFGSTTRRSPFRSTIRRPPFGSTARRPPLGSTIRRQVQALQPLLAGDRTSGALARGPAQPRAVPARRRRSGADRRPALLERRLCVLGEDAWPPNKRRRQRDGPARAKQSQAKPRQLPRPPRRARHAK